MVIMSILDVVRMGAPLFIETNDSGASDASTEVTPCVSDASTTSEPTDSSSAADVPMAVAAYGAAIIPDE
jgi:hypothetical protein